MLYLPHEIPKASGARKPRSGGLSTVFLHATTLRALPQGITAIVTRRAKAPPAIEEMIMRTARAIPVRRNTALAASRYITPHRLGTEAAAPAS